MIDLNEMALIVFAVNRRKIPDIPVSEGALKAARLLNVLANSGDFPVPGPRWLTFDQAADYARVSRRTLLRWRSQPDPLPTHGRRIDRDQLDAFIRNGHRWPTSRHARTSDGVEAGEARQSET